VSELSRRPRPTPAELDAARGRTVADVIGPGLDVLFCGINPGLWSAAVGHHFAHPGNRFWKALHASGFTDTLLSPAEEHRHLVVELVARHEEAVFRRALDGVAQRADAARDDRDLAAGVGVTNLVTRATASADEVGREELRRGAGRLAGKSERWGPRAVAVLGLGAYRVAFGRPRAAVGEQEESLGQARVWLLPNPSGLQGHYRLEDVVAELRRLRSTLAATGGAR